MFCCTVGYKCISAMDGVKFKFNDIISMYTKATSERRPKIFYIIFILLWLIFKPVSE